MDVGVRLRFELVGEEPAVRLGEFDGLLVHTEAFERARREDDLRAEHSHELASLDGETVSHGDYERIAFCAQTMARPMPVLPLVASTTVWPGLSAPLRSPSSIMLSASRSLTEAAGLKNSALA